MKYHIINILLAILITVPAVQAQEKTENKVKEVSFKVDGVCKMCKARIEEAALYTRGVKFAEWNKETQMLKVAYKTKKVEAKTIHKNIADAGHDTEEAKAPDEAYAQLPGCCKYRDGVEIH